MIKKLILLSIIGTLFIFYCSFSCAELRITADPLDGSRRLSLSDRGVGVDLPKDVRVRVSGTSGQRYKVFQRLEGPLVGQNGESLRGDLIVSGPVSGSNMVGSLYGQEGQPLGFSDRLIYSSGNGGEDVSFTVRYMAGTQREVKAGQYQGKIVFMVQPEGAANEQQTLSVFFEKVDAPVANVISGHGSSRIMLSDALGGIMEDSIRITLPGASASTVKIFQRWESPLRNDLGEELIEGLVVAQVVAQRNNGEDRGAVVPVAFEQKLLFSSQDVSGPWDVRIFMDPEVLSQQLAGKYSGRWHLVVQQDQARSEHTIDVSCEISPVFSLDVEFPPEGVRFAKVLPNLAPQEKEVMVRVRSNLGRPYQVLQSMDMPMTNEKGELYDQEHFLFRVTLDSHGKGISKFAEYAPMKTGDQAVFISDNGAPAEFRVQYRIEGYPQMNGGDFAAPIKYSLNQN